MMRDMEHLYLTLFEWFVEYFYRLLMNTIIKIYLTYLQNRLLGSTKPHPQNTDKALKIDSQPLTSTQTLNTSNSTLRIRTHLTFIDL